MALKSEVWGTPYFTFMNIMKAEPLPTAAKDNPGAPFGEPSPPLGVSVDGLSFLPRGRAEILHLGRWGEREEINFSVITELWSEIDVRT